MNTVFCWLISVPWIDYRLPSAGYVQGAPSAVGPEQEHHHRGCHGIQILTSFSYHHQMNVNKGGKGLFKLEVELLGPYFIFRLVAKRGAGP